MKKFSDSPFKRTRRVEWLEHGHTMPRSGPTSPVYILYMFAKCVVATCVLGVVCGCALVERVSEGVRDLPALMLGQTSSNSDTSGATSPYNPELFQAPWDNAVALSSMKPKPLSHIFKIPNSSDILAVSLDGRVVLIRAQNWYHILSIGFAPQAVGIDAERRYLVAAMPGGGVQVSDLFARNAAVATNTRISSRISSLCVFPAHSGVVLGGADGKIYRWMFLAPTPREDILSDLDRSFERYLGTASVISALACHPGGRFFIAGNWSGSLTAWLNSNADIYEGFADEQLRPGGLFSEVATKVGARGSDDSSVERIAITPDGELVYVLKKSGALEAWSVRGMKLLAYTKALRGDAKDLALGDDGLSVAILSRSGEVSLWELQVEQHREGASRNFTFVNTGLAKLPEARLLLVHSQTSVLVATDEGAMRSVQVEPIQNEPSEGVTQ